MSLRDNERFVVIDITTCAYQENESEPLCGLITDRALFMPFGMPAMPLCTFHAYEFRDWTLDNTLAQFASIMTEDDFIESLRLDEDDDI